LPLSLLHALVSRANYDDKVSL